MGARVLGVVSTMAKKAIAAAAGAHDVVLADDFLGAVKACTNGGVDLVVDPVGGDRFTDSLRCLAPEGRLLVIGFAGGEIPSVKVNRLLLHNTAVLGAGWFPFGPMRPGFLRKQWAALMPHLESGALDPILGRSFPLERTTDALLELDQRRATGKIFIQLRPE
jgi:NADPH2:quinone reductase